MTVPDDLCKTVVGSGRWRHPEMPYLQPLAALLGVGLTTLGSVLYPRSTERPELRRRRSVVSAGGRSACTAWPIWPLCALVVLTAEMAVAGEDLAFARDVLRRQGAAARCSSEELDEALRAVAAVLLANGWVTDLRDAEEGEA